MPVVCSTSSTCRQTLACDVQTRVFKGCREEILALTEVRGVKNNRVRTCAAATDSLRCCAKCQQEEG